MNRRLTKFIALTLIMAMAIGVAGCSKVEDLFALHHDSDFETGLVGTEDRLEISTSEELTYPDHIATYDEIHPGHANGTVSGQEASDLLDEIELEVLRNQLTSYADIELLFENPEDFGLSWETVSWGEINLTDDEDIAFINNILEQLYSIDYESLDEQDRIFYDKIVWDTEEAQYAQQFTAFDYYEGYFNPLVGIQTEIEFLLTVYSFETIEDAENYILLVEDVDRYFDDICTFEEARAEYGYAYSPESYEQIAASFDAIVDGAEDCFLFQSFEDRLDAIEGLSDSDREDLINRHEAAMTDYFFEEMEECADRMRALKDYNGVDVGVCEYPGGDAYYAMLCRKLTNSNKDVETTMSELETVFNNIYMGFVMTAQDPNFDFTAFSTDNYSVGDMDANLQYLLNTISSDFPELPAHSYNTMDVPEALQANFSPAAYLGYHLDNYNSNLVLTNPANINDVFGTVCAHEGYPGHMYQSVYSRTICEHPYMYLTASIGYVEGWATYVQYYSYKYFTDDPLVMSARIALYLTDTLMMAYADIGIHAYGWNLQELSDHLGELLGTPVSPDMFTDLYTMLVLDPGYAMKYGCGYVNTGLVLNDLHTQFPDATDLEVYTAYLNAQPATFEQIEATAIAALS